MTVSASSAPERQHAVAENGLIYIFLIAAALIILLPMFWMVSTAFKLYRDTFHQPPIWIPSYFTLSNFDRVFSVVPFGTMMFTSLKVALLSTLGQVISCTTAGYAI